MARTSDSLSGFCLLLYFRLFSDLLFNWRRAPVAAGIYFLEAAIILMAAQVHTANGAVVFLVFISFTVNSTHSILGTAAAMDIGGRKRPVLPPGY